MQIITIVSLVLVALAVASARPGDDKYTKKFDNVDLYEVLKNKRLLKNYANCLMDKGNCTPDAAELRKVIPDALTNECSKCTDKQKEGAIKVLKYLIENEPKIFDDLERKYDPSGEFKIKYCKRAEEEKVDTMGRCA